MTLVHDHQKVKPKVCYHCGEACASTVIYQDDHPFCCNGCKSVYEILNGCSLEEYYQLEANPGIRPKDEPGRFDFLELEEVRARIIRFENESIYKIRLFIPEMHCSSCIYLLEQLHKLNPAIHTSRVNFQQRELSVTIDHTNDALHSVFSLLSRLGYTPMITDEREEGALRDSRSLLIKIGITGFCFGNIMLFSIPEYLSGRSVITPEFEHLFNILIVVLILPALYFGAKDYVVAAWKNLRHRYLSVDVPIVIGIAALTARSLYEIIRMGEPGYFDSLAGFLFFLLIGKWFQSRTYEHLSFDKDFQSFLPLAVLAKQDDAYRPVRVQDLKKGDIIQLRSHEVLPVSARLLEDHAEFDYSFVTGESAAVIKKKKDHLFAGGRLNSARALLMVSEETNQGYLRDLWKEQDVKFRRSRLIDLIDKISHRFTLIVLLIAGAGLAYWSWAGSFEHALEIFTAILIVACPCALALAAPFTYGNASRLLSGIDVYLKNSSVIERLGTVKRLVFDKTGTLTQKNDTEVQYFGKALDSETEADLFSIVSCSIHPLSKTLARHLSGHAISTPAADFREESGYGLKATVRNHTYYMGSSGWLEQNGLPVDEPASGGRTRVWIGRDGEIRGYFEFSNVYRRGILQQVRRIARRYPVSIISGDGRFEEGYLRESLGPDVDLAFEQRPDDKYRYIDRLKEVSGEIVMMLGDGINDAKSLKHSDIGIAITEDAGSFTPNSDIIMHADSLVKLPDILRYGRDSRRVLYFCLTISLIYNLIGLTFAFAGLLTPFVAAVLMPVSSISVVIIATGLTTYYAKKRKVIG